MNHRNAKEVKRQDGWKTVSRQVSMFRADNDVYFQNMLGNFFGHLHMKNSPFRTDSTILGTFLGISVGVFVLVTKGLNEGTRYVSMVDGVVQLVVLTRITDTP